MIKLPQSIVVKIKYNHVCKAFTTVASIYVLDKMLARKIINKKQ